MAEDSLPAEEYHPQQTPEGSPGSSPKKQGPCQINKRLLPIKGYYFFFMSGVGDLLPFIPLYMQYLGLTSHETGIIYGIMPFVGFFMRPLIGAVADKYKRHKHVLMLVTLLTGIFYFLLVVVPKRPGPVVMSIQTKFECNTQDSFLQDCYNPGGETRCQQSLTVYGNNTLATNTNTTVPVKCAFMCKLSKSAELTNFQACFTNDTGPYNQDRCNGTLSHQHHLNFSIPDLESLMMREIPEDRFMDGQQECRVYDLKEVLSLKDSNHKSWQILCERELVLDCELDCGQSEICQTDDFDTTFFAFFFIFLLSNIFFAPIFPILDAAAYDNLGDQHHLWGKQRVWGTFGFALWAVTATFIMYQQFQNNQEVNYSMMFYLFLPLCVVSTGVAHFMNMSSEVVCGQFVKNVWNLLSHLEISCFLLVIMYFGMLTGGLEAFLFWYLNGLGSNPLVFGLILLVNCAAEVPMLWIAGYIIKRTGHIACLYLACLCFGLRMLVYSFIQEPWLVLLVEPCHGVTFALMYAAASAYASIVAPPGMSATVQGLLGGMHFGFGKGIGSLVTGFMFESLGPRWTWRTFSIVSVVLMLVYAALNFFVFKTPHKPLTVRQRTGTDGQEDSTKQEEVLISPNPATQENTAVMA